MTAAVFGRPTPSSARPWPWPVASPSTNTGPAVPWSVPSLAFARTRRPNSEYTSTTTFRPGADAAIRRVNPLSAASTCPSSRSCVPRSAAWVSNPPSDAENTRVGTRASTQTRHQLELTGQLRPTARCGPLQRQSRGGLQLLQVPHRRRGPGPPGVVGRVRGGEPRRGPAERTAGQVEPAGCEGRGRPPLSHQERRQHRLHRQRPQRVVGPVEQRHGTESAGRDGRRQGPDRIFAATRRRRQGVPTRRGAWRAAR